MKLRTDRLRPHHLLVAIAVLLVAVFLLGRLTVGTPEQSHADHGGSTGDGGGEPTAQVWTCSMHPQIRQHKPGRCPLCGMDLIPVESSGDDEANAREITLSRRAMQLAAVQTAPVERRQVANELRLVGKVDYDETRLRTISAWVAGRIDRLYVDYTGEVVAAGQPLASLYSPELLTAQEELLQAIRGAESLQGSELASIRASAQATVRAAREKLRLLGLTAAQIRQLEERGRADDHVTIHAPHGGVVIRKEAVEGTYVQTGTPIYTVADLSRVWVQMEAYESDLAWLKVGQEVAFAAQAYPGERFTGTIAFIDPVVNGRTRTLKVRLEVPNPRGRLKPEMLVHARVHAAVPTAGAAPLVIPATAPLITGRRAVVYVALPGSRGTFEGREVVLGPRAGDHYVVHEGLREGEMVVVNGAFKIDSAVQILAKPSMMNPAANSSVAAEERAAHGELSVSPAAAERLTTLFTAYFDLHASLSHDRLPDAIAIAGKLRVALGQLPVRLLSGAARAEWGEDQLDLAQGVRTVESAEDIAAARVGFDQLSQAMIAVAQKLGTGKAHPVLRFHCPMAFDNRGADWLQDHEGVENPYYGASMYRCGDQVGSLTAVGGKAEQHE